MPNKPTEHPALLEARKQSREPLVLHQIALSKFTHDADQSDKEKKNRGDHRTRVAVRIAKRWIAKAAALIASSCVHARHLPIGFEQNVPGRSGRG
jgi:hypothetical protein